MWFRRPGKNMAMLVHDGLAWRGYALQGARGEWSVTGCAEETARNARQLPKGMLEFIGQTGSKRLRILLAGDVHVLTTALPEDATDEELHTALAYEAQGEAGLEAAGHRMAAVQAHWLKMGSDRKTLLVAGYEIETLEKLAADAESEGARFDGVGSLELAMLAAHAQRTPERRLLLVRERTSLYAVPASNPQPFAMATLPLGIDAGADSTGRERAERARERLNQHSTMPLTVAISCGHERVHAQIASCLGVCRDIEHVDWKDLEAEAILIGAGGRVGGVDGPCPWIGLAPAPRDPHRHGTVMFGLILVAALSWLGLRWQGLKSDLNEARANRTAWENLESIRKQAKDDNKSLLDRQKAVLTQKAMLEHPQSVPKGLLPLMKTLAEHMPPYSSLEAIHQREGGGFEITGLTRWQEGLPQLDAALRNIEGMHREIGNLEEIPGENAQRFQYNLVPGKDRP